MSGLIYDRGACQYSLELDDELLSAMDNVEHSYLQNVQNLDMLVRFSVKVPTWFPLQSTSFTSGLYLHYKMTLASGQAQLACSLLQLYSSISKRFRHLFSQMPSKVNSGVRDDFVRQQLRVVSRWAFPRVFSHGPAYTFFMHMELLGAKSPWTREMVEKDITKWTSGGEGGDLELLKPYIDDIFAEWGHDSEPKNTLRFRDFCNDPIRWGTSGGAKKSIIGQNEYRSKWAWAYSRMLNRDGTFKEPNQYDLYEEALLEPEVCKVALKEEEKKTREIITTPIASYLRQSYLAYRSNRLPGDSPISNPAWLGTFQSTIYPWMGCADAERFDHSVTKEMVKYVIKKMGDIDDETRQVAKDELDSIDRLQVEWNGRTWPYRGGLLSGWRITSLLGTIMSMSIGRYIIKQNNIPGARAVGMGDDIIIASPRFGLTKKQLFDSYARTGFNINLTKTISGPVGEFLRQVYAQRGICGYPCSAMGATLYAPPWLERYSLEKEQELAKNWLTLYSRYLFHATDVDRLTKLTKGLIKLDIHQHFKVSGDLDKWLNTPIPAGGGGPIEWSRMSEWTRLEVQGDVDRTPSSFLSLFDLYPGQKPPKSKWVKKRCVPINVLNVKHDASNLRRTTQEFEPIIPKNVNKTTAFIAFITQDSVTIGKFEKMIGTKIPRGMRTMPRLEIIKFLMGVEQNLSAFCSVQTTNDALGGLSRVFKNVYTLASRNRRLSSSADTPAIATVYAQQVYSKYEFVSGTW